MPAARARGTVEGPAKEPLVDAWSGLLIISVLATLFGLIFVWMDYSDYRKDELPKVKPLPKIEIPQSK